MLILIFENMLGGGAILQKIVSSTSQTVLRRCIYHINLFIKNIYAALTLFLPAKFWRFRKEGNQYGSNPQLIASW